MNRVMQGRQAAKGMTLIELAVVIAILTVLSGFAMLSWSSLDENRDATLVQAAQANLQTVISQGSLRLDKSPQQLLAENSDNIQRAVRVLLEDDQNGNAKNELDFQVAGNTANLSINSGRRTATFSISNNGDVALSGLGGSQNWSQYGVQNGVIKRN